MGGGKKKNRSSDASQQSASNGVKSEQNQGSAEGGSMKQNTQNNGPKVPDNINNLTSKMTRVSINESTESSVNSTAGKRSNSKTEKASNNVNDETPRSREEIQAERKAKAAEAKARKAAATAAKKVAATNKPEGEKNQTEKAQKKDYSKKEGSAVKQKEPESNVGTSAPRNAADINKPVLTGSSARLSMPFRHVHFNMTPVRGEERLPREPTQVDVSDINVHPAFLDFASKCTSGHVVGIDAICVAFIHAFKEFLMDYTLDDNRKMSHDLNEMASQQYKYLTEHGSQPLPLALGNLVRQLRKEINQLESDISEKDGKERLRDWLDDFIAQNFDLAFRAISSFCFDKMANTPYVVTYSWCPVVERIILDAYERNLAFHLCIIDSPTVQRGKQLAKTLSARNIGCTYGMLNAVGYVMKQCSLVLLGCSAILSNGYVVADRGSSQVALVASAANVPVLVAAQTFKFADRVQLFDRGQRETSVLIEEQKETIPADLVTALVTELRILHPSSAPAVLKAKQLAVG